MKTNRSFPFVAKIYGIVVTSLMLLIFGSYLIGDIIEDGIGEFKVIASALVHWYDDPTGFFFIYLIGYAVVWWNPLWGAVIIMTGSLLSLVINIDNPGFIIFSIPTFLVGFFYLISWLDDRKKIKNIA